MTPTSSPSTKSTCFLKPLPIASARYSDLFLYRLTLVKAARQPWRCFSCSSLRVTSTTRIFGAANVDPRETLPRIRNIFNSAIRVTLTVISVSPPSYLRNP